MNDSEFRGFDIYEIQRNEDGFYLHEIEVKSQNTRDKENKFYLMYKDKLDALNVFIKEKNELIKKSIFVASDPDLTNEIAIYLGFFQDENTHLKTK